MKTDVKELRKFSIILFLCFGIIGLLVLWRKGEAGLIFCGIGLAFLLCGLTLPKLLVYPYKGWMALSAMLGFLMSHLILLLMYYLVITPIGISMRILGKNFLLERIDRDVNTYWIKKEQKLYVSERSEKMF